ncbi:MAG: OsmC family protein [Microbacteriaceae bacterium]
MSTVTDLANPLAAIIAATESDVAADVSKAAAVFRVAGSSTGRVSSTIRIGKFTIDADEPPALGEGTAPNPVEYALAALLACQVATYRVWAVNLGISLDTVDISIAGDLDFRGFFGIEESVRPGFSGIRLDVKLGGPEPERYAELQATVNAHCPVLDLFRNPTPVESTLTVA